MRITCGTCWIAGRLWTEFQAGSPVSIVCASGGSDGFGSDRSFAGGNGHREKAGHCVVCDEPMRAGKAWLFRCPSCGYWRSNLAAGAGRGVEGLDALRRSNAQRLLSQLRRHMPLASARFLEVGSAEGWFLDALQGAGAEVIGMEPAPELAGRLRARGISVIEGFLPEALPEGERFDLIAFNDVFEHLPDVVASLQACERHLNEGGILLLNLPNSRGVLFQVANWLDRLGGSGPFDRLWQKNVPSPHRLAERIENSYRGLTGALVHLGLLCLLPLQGLLSPYIMVFLFRKPVR